MQVPIDLPDHLHQAIRASGKPLLFLDHQPSGERYVMLPLEEYVAICMEAAPDGLTIEEQQWLLVQAGKRAGWDDPQMDIYNDIEPQQGGQRETDDESPRH